MDVSAAVTRLAREESGHVLALLASRFGDLDLADESVQDALVEALYWSVVPDNPAAWLYTVARNRAVDRLRRRAAALRRELRAATDRAVVDQPAPPAGLALLDRVSGLERYHLYWAARAELLLRNGQEDAAAAAFQQARTLAVNPAEQRHLDARIAALPQA